MSFQYPNGWNLSEDSAPIGNIDNNLTVRLNKNDSEIDIQVFPNDSNNKSMDEESKDSINTDYVYKGMNKDNLTNITYKVFVYGSDADAITIYLFKVGNKTVEILGPNSEKEVMESILQTIN